jgi:arsenite oxidase small subunit
MTTCKNEGKSQGECMTRRAFLFRGGAAAVATVILPALPGFEGQARAAQVARYPRMKIGKLSKLVKDKPVVFNYPDKGMGSQSVLVKLGVPAGGGVGRDGDVVAFNSQCTHMGAPMSSNYQPEHQVLGPCAFHQTTFDLTRHGMVVAGHATESLPQVLLELKGDDIYAVGMIGLIYGRHDNVAAKA